ncbi:hypothetical protein K443DRAFT_682708, partial [Laccaria amethystina LaAM-08-1]
LTDFEMAQPSEVEPKDSDWVRLETTDGFTYLVKRKVALASGTMRNMLDPTSGYTEAKTRICSMKERGIITEKLVEYMCFKTHYESAATKEDIPANEFMERVPPEIILELFVFSLPPRWADKSGRLLAADYQEM